MVLKSIVLGLLIFLVDFLVYSFYILITTDPKDRHVMLSKLKFVIPIGLFMQIFFAMIFVFTFRFLAVFKALDTTVGGGLYFSYVLFLPMLYMLFNNWIWLDSKRTPMYINIAAWGIKLAICGVFTPFI